jgi:two-component system, OmpR family, response regulator
MPALEYEGPQQQEECCPVCGGPWKEPKDIQVENERVLYKGIALSLTKQAHTVFSLLIKRQGRVVNKEAIWNNLYGTRADGGPDPAIINIYVARIRAVIREYSLPVKLETVWGVGWVLKRKEIASAA